MHLQWEGPLGVRSKCTLSLHNKCRTALFTVGFAFWFGVEFQKDGSIDDKLA